MPASEAPQHPRPLVIAIDGPSGSGKSSVSREVAGRLDLAYLDTGAMYRALCWSVLEADIDPVADPAAVTEAARTLDLQLATDPATTTVRVSGVDVTDAIREPRISAAVSAVATNLEVRAELLHRQRALIAASAEGRHRGVVAEGRDITTVVAPDATVRVLLTASESARLTRRAIEVHGSADHDAIDAMRDLVVRRDSDDATVSSFHTAADGVVHLDSTRLTFEQTVQAVLDIVSSQAGGGMVELADLPGVRLDAAELLTPSGVGSSA